MSDEELIGYLFDLLDPDDRDAVTARLATDSEFAARLEQLRISAGPMLAVMEAERDDLPEPPPGLTVRTIAKVADHVVEHDPRPPEPAPSESVITAFLREYADTPRDLEFGSGTRAKPAQSAANEPRRAPPTDGPEYRTTGRFRADMLVAACIAFVGFGLVMSGIAKARQQSRVVACQNSLRTLHNGLAGYADADPQGRYPQIGTKTHPTADAFAPSLVDLGYLPSGYKPGCPAGSEECPTYTYTLGFRGPKDELLGLRRPTTTDTADENDLMPIAADYPTASAAPGAGPVSPHGRCMNVLFVGGNVRSTTSPNVGPHGDDIYRNVFGHVAAGANRADAVLGGAGTKP